ncbi:hypothetical protein SAMN05444355_103272 [Flavobacterium frigoris]|uniref:Uncharacterized protein n=1 Tax=Flavobacterium frigoris TaxID=229204 RepID=A0A1H9HVT2_FLAFI|nr:hypothetical protein SAMN05444355_103272 [Flavobacterium frigoris]
MTTDTPDLITFVIVYIKLYVFNLNCIIFNIFFAKLWRFI